MIRDDKFANSAKVTFSDWKKHFVLSAVQAINYFLLSLYTDVSFLTFIDICSPRRLRTLHLLISPHVLISPRPIII